MFIPAVLEMFEFIYKQMTTTDGFILLFCINDNLYTYVNAYKEYMLPFVNDFFSFNEKDSP